jgi:hypothetical protein
MIGRQRPYLSYLLRLWLVDDDGLAWRASLESPRTADRHGFTSLEGLFNFLEAETRDLAAAEQWEAEAPGAAASEAGKEVAMTTPDQLLEDLLGRAVTDEEFRSVLLADPQRALREGGFELRAEALAALLETDRGSIAEGLDQRLSKLLRLDV